MSEDKKHCPVCGEFMEKKKSAKYRKGKWVCRECGIHKPIDRTDVKRRWERRPVISGEGGAVTRD